MRESSAQSKKELVEVQAEVKRLTATVNSLKEAEVQNERNQQALAKDLLTLRAKIRILLHQIPTIIKAQQPPPLRKNLNVSK